MKKFMSKLVRNFFVFLVLFIFFCAVVGREAEVLTTMQCGLIMLADAFIGFWVYWFECLIEYNKRKRRKAKRRITVEPSPFDLDMIEYRRAF